MDTVNEILETIVKFLSGLNGLPGFVLIYLLCLGFGFLLKKISRFPNDAIPVVIVLIGAILNMLIAEANDETKTPFRIWLVRNFVLGCLYGLLAWATHANRRRIPLVKRFFAQDPPTNPEAFKIADHPECRPPTSIPPNK